MRSWKGLIEINELSFEESTHTYKLDGVEIPSVTTIMKPLSQSLYKTVDEAVLNKAAERGTIIHNAIENFIKFGFSDCPHEYITYFHAFLQWCKDYSVEIIQSEFKTYHKLMKYAGTIDLICKIGGEKFIVDYKTSASVNRMLTGVQTEAYAKAFESHGMKIDKKAILHLTKYGKYDFIEYNHNDYESWNVFVALMTIRNHIEKYQGGQS